MSGRELADQLEVTRRTLRTYIKSLNEFRAGLIDSNTHSGYRLNHELFSEDIILNYQTENRRHTPDFRLIHMIKQLIESDYLEVSELADLFYVSEGTILSDITKINSIISPFKDLEIKRQKGRAVLRGSEYSKRRLYRRMLTEELQEDFLNIEQLDRLYPDLNMRLVSELTEEIFEEFNYSITTSQFKLLLIHIGISIDRINKNQMIDEPDSANLCLQDNIEWEISTQLYRRIKEEYQLKISNSEIDYLADLLKNNQAKKQEAVSVNIGGQFIDIKNLLGETFQYLNTMFGTQFSSEDDLAMNFVYHIKALVDRAKKKRHYTTRPLTDVKQDYPFIFELGVVAAKFIEQETQIQISEDEISYIALHLGAIYSSKPNSAKIKAAMCSSINPNLARMAIQKIMSNFNHKLEEIRLVETIEEQFLIEEDIDLVLTFNDINKEISLPQLMISPFFNEEDNIKLFEILYEIEKTKKFSQFKLNIGKLIRDEFFYKDLICHEVEDLIRRLSTDLFQAGIVDHEFEASVIQRERYSPTSFGYSLAIPHPMVMNSKKSTVSVCILEEAMKWGDHEVSIVFLLAIKEKDSGFMKLFFDWLSLMIDQPERMSKLKEAHHRDEFIEVILNQ